MRSLVTSVGVVLLSLVFSFSVSGQTQPALREVPVKGVITLLDLGANKCIPCKMMAPILAELKKEYAGRMHVEFIDVGEKPEEARKYGIRMIPTQVFLAANGKELYRHVGFFSKEDILKKWKELGVDLRVPRPGA